jgi:glucosylceramidase
MKRHKTIKTAIVILTLLAWISPVQANLLSNGTFNDPASGAWPTGWTGWTTGTTGWANHENNAGVSYNGSYYIVCGATGWDTGAGGFSQTVPATAGMKYTLSVLSGADAWWLPYGEMRMFFLNASNAQVGQAVRATVDPAVYGQNYDIPHPWARYTLTATAPAGTTQVKVEFSEPHGQGSVWFENAVLEDNNPDYNDDFFVDYADFKIFSSAWMKTASQYDLNNDNIVNINDLMIFNQYWMAHLNTAGARTIAVDPAATYQEIEGFGASLTDSSAWLIYRFLNASERQAVLTDLFDPVNGIGLSYLRQPMGSSDFRLQNYSYDDLPAGVYTDYSLNYFSIAYDESYIVPTLEQILAINPNVRIMGSPWSPPVWMKDSGQIGGGHLKNDVYSTYANYFVKFIQAYAAHGIAIDAVTLQNEPHNEPWGSPGCRMEPADQIKLVKEMGPAFAANNITTKILVWDHNWDEPDFPLTVLADAQARSFIYGVGWHHYGGDVSAQTIVHNAYPDKGVYFTEGSDGSWADYGFDSNLIGNGTFVVNVLRNWAKTVIKWNLALDENNGPLLGGSSTCYGVVTINQSNRQISPRPQYYALGHASKFLRPGALRIDSGQSGSVYTVAFKNTDGSMVLYTVNTGTSSDTLKLTWNNQWVISAIPARSIMTFCWNNVSNAKVDIYLTTGNKSSLLEHRNPVYFHN